MVLMGFIMRYSDSNLLSSVSPPVILDYIHGAMFILCFLVSSILNPLVFRHYWRAAPSLAGSLYMVLSLSDLITNSVRPLFICLLHFAPKAPETLLVATSYNLQGQIVVGSLTILTRIAFSVSACTGAMLAFTRLIRIQYPFYHTRRGAIVLTIGCVGLEQLVVLLLGFTTPGVVLMVFSCTGMGVPVKQGTELAKLLSTTSFYTALINIPIVLSFLLSSSTSVWAVVVLVRTIRGNKVTGVSGVGQHQVTDGRLKTRIRQGLTKFKGCLSLCLLNLTSMLMAVSFIGVLVLIKSLPEDQTTLGETFKLCHPAYVLDTVLPSIIAAVNPTVICLLNEELSRSFKIRWCR